MSCYGVYINSVYVSAVERMRGDAARDFSLGWRLDGWFDKWQRRQEGASDAIRPQWRRHRAPRLIESAPFFIRRRLSQPIGI